MGPVVYSLCALTAFACSVMLFLGFKRSGNRLLFWSALCFAGLTINNLLLIIDLVLIESIDFYTARNITVMLSMCLLIYGLIWEVE